MKANKIVVTITVETLSVDSVPALINSMNNQLQSEFTSGKLVADDGDTITWSIKSKEIEF